MDPTVHATGRRLTDYEGGIDVASESFLVTNVSVFDGDSGSIAAEFGVAVIDDKISWVGPANEAPEGSSLNVIDGRGHTLLPGLIDCHTHLSNDASPKFFEQCISDSVTTASIRGVLNCWRHLDGGVTTVRDSGASNGVALGLRDAVANGLIEGPRIHASGRPITMTGGHCYFMGGEADGVDGVRKAARAELKLGIDFLKIMATGGVQTPSTMPGQTTLQVDELRAAADEAHNAGKRTSCHAISAAGVKNALRAGLDSIEHWYYLDDEGIELGLSTGAYFVPTMIAVHQTIVNISSDVNDWVLSQTKDVGENNRLSFRAGLEAGLKIATGTDAGTPFNPHGNVAGEAAIMVDSGATPTQALIAATRHGAENLGIADKVGTIEAGKVADLILVAGDPTQDISILQDVRLVAKEGRIVRDRISPKKSSHPSE
jgi:imidazolonepropionase-like amidohydrolase